MGSIKLCAGLVLAVLVAGCGLDKSDGTTSVFDPKEQRDRDKYGTITGEDGITLFGSRTREPGSATGGGGIGVNAFLWQASLETFDFIPFASADPFGGLIITDWYQPAATPRERLKIQIFIRDVALRADGVKVSLFRQVMDEQGRWLDAEVAPATITELEDKVLTRARELRIEQADAGS